MLKKSCLSFVLWSVLSGGVVMAQPSALPDAGLERERGRETREFLELQETLEKQAEEPPVLEIDDENARAPEVADDRDIIPVEEVRVDSSEILSGKDIARVTGRYEGKTVSLRDLYRMIEEINALYRAQEVLTAKAVLPPQRIEEGIVVVRLIEGRVGRIELLERRFTRVSFIRRRLSIAGGELLDLKELEKDLFFFNRTQDVHLQAELVPGEEFGTTDVVLHVQEPAPYLITVYGDNAGADSLGEERVGAILAIPSMFGYRDLFILSGLWAEGTKGGSASYEIPLGTLGTRGGVSFDKNLISVNSGPFSDLELDGDFYDLAFYLRHTFLVRRSYTLTGVLEYHARRSVTEFGGIEIATSRVRTAVAGGELQAWDKKGYWATRHTFTQGLDSMGGDRSFFRYNGDLTRLQILTPETNLLVRLGGQWADVDQLPSSEQFQIGGLATVRGYDEGLLVGDDGYLVSAELTFPFLPEAQLGRFALQKAVKGALFVDHGGAFPFKGDGESIDSDDFLTSAGLGLVFDFGDYFSARIYLGFPLHDPTNDQDERIHFSLQTAIF